MIYINYILMYIIWYILMYISLKYLLLTTRKCSQIHITVNDRNVNYSKWTVIDYITHITYVDAYFSNSGSGISYLRVYYNETGYEFLLI